MKTLYRPDLNRTSAALLNGSPLSMFFQSLLPSFNLQQQQQGAQQGPGVVPVPGGVQGEQQRAAEAARENEGTLLSNS